MTLATMFFAKDVILPVVLGFMLALTLGPWVRWLAKKGVPAALSAAVMIFGFVGVIGFAVLMMGGSVASWFDDIPRIAMEFQQKLRGVIDSIAAFQDASQQVEDLANGGEDNVARVAIQQPGLLSTAASNFASFVTSLAVGAILALFLLSSGNLFYVKIVESFPRFGDKKLALTVIYEVERRMSHYLIAITCINAVLGLAVGIAMYLLKMPFPFVWGLAAFFLNFLPFLGGVIGTIGVGAFAVVHFDNLYYAMLAPLAYQVLTAIEGQLLTPLILGARLQLNVVAVFMTVIFWAWLWGIPGALMAVPILVLMKVICENVPTLATFGNFLSGRSVVPDIELAKAQTATAPHK